MARPELVANSDAVWITMEESTNLMTVSGLLLFDDIIDHERLKQTIENRLLTYKRFKQRIVEPSIPLAPLFWETDSNFNLDAHILRVGLPSPNDEATLQEMVSRLVSTPLDQTKPLWQVHIIENVGSGSAVLARMHHALADGLALVMVLLSLADFAPDAPPRPPKEEKEKKSSSLLGNLRKQANSTIAAVSKTATSLVNEGMETVKNPSKAMEFAQKGAENARTVGQLLTESADPKTRFKGKLGVGKKVAWSRAIPLSDIKTIKNTLGGGVNEVLVTAVAGALRTHMVSKGDQMQGITIRAAMPMNIRGKSEMGKLGNSYGVAFVPLPLYLESSIDRLEEISETMARMKNSDETIVTFGIQKGIEFTHHDVQSELLKLFSARATAVMSNIPGPPMPLYIAGSQIKQLMFWMPQVGKVGISISMLSYAGQVFFGIAADDGLIPNPNELLDAVYREIDSLLALATDAKK
ncbi:MAG: wax ester/triacylglycerol synthase family O-acyltransferase [Chloroflexota bacterium]